MILFKHRVSFTISLVVGIFLVHHLVFSYDDVIVHPSLSGEMVKLYNLNFGDELTGEEIKWIKQGSTEEDKFYGAAIRSMNHFYNPLGVKEWIDFTVKKNLVPEPDFTAKEWAHNAVAQSSYPGGVYTWEQGVEDYAYGNKEHAYKSLGHILHLLEDMAVPAHTRSDLHISPKELESYKNNKLFNEFLVDYEPYETWTGNEAKTGNLDFDFASKLFQENKKPVIFDDIDKYFDDMAFYSNKNFFSKDTIYSYDDPKILYKKNEKLNNGKYIVYGWGMDENRKNFRLAKLDTDFNKSNYIINEGVEGVEKVEFDYWSRLAPKAILDGAGVIKLFKEEAKKAEEKNKAITGFPLAKEIYGIRKDPGNNTFISLLRTGVVVWKISNNIKISVAKFYIEKAVSALAAVRDAVQYAVVRASDPLSAAIKNGNAMVGDLFSDFLRNINRISIYGLASPNFKEITGAGNGTAGSAANQTDFVEAETDRPLAGDTDLEKTQNIGRLIANNDAEPLNALNSFNNREQNIVVNNGGGDSITIQFTDEINPENVLPPKNRPNDFSNQNKQSSGDVNIAAGSNNNASHPVGGSDKNDSSLSSSESDIISVPKFSPTPTPTPTPTLTLTPSPTPTPTPTPDTISAIPDPISDLVAQSGGKRGQIMLAWTEPENAVSYDIFYSQSPITEDYASGYFFLEAPAVESGASRYFTLDNLAPGREFFFAVKSKNKEENISRGSNTAAAISNGRAENVVISEIQIGGNAAKEEFVELYNPSSRYVNLEDLPLKLHIINSKSEDVSKKLTYKTTGKTIAPHGYFLIASEEYKGTVLPDAVYSSSGNSLVANGAVYISTGAKDKEGVMDLVGWGDQPAGGYETSPLSNLEKNKSMERKANFDSGSESMVSGKDKYRGNSWDSDNNSNDFVLRDNPDPRNSRDGYTEPRENAPPDIGIVSPNGGQMFLAGENINFEARIKDAEDIFVSDKNIFWSSDISGTIGTGMKFSLDNLAAGAHRLTLNAVDADGAAASSYADIFVRNDHWSVPEPVLAEENMNNPKIAVDSLGNIRAVAIEPNNWGDLVYLTNESGKWESDSLPKINGAISVIDYAEIKVDKNDNVYIFFDGKENRDGCFTYVYYIEKIGGAWTLPRIVSIAGENYFSAALDNDGEINLLVKPYIPGFNCSISIDGNIHYFHTVGGVLQPERVLASPAGVSVSLPVAAHDSNNNLYLFVASRNGSSPGLLYASYDAASDSFDSWRQIDTGKALSTSLGLSAIFDKENKAHLFFVDNADGDLNKGIWRISSSDFSLWTAEKLPGTSDIDTAWFRGWKMNPVLDSRGKIHFVWQKNADLYYDTDFSGAWSEPKIILSGGVYPDLAVDKENNLRLMYQAFNKNILPKMEYSSSSEL